jgi:TRAP-type C4-dicarboxylate transport system substrate-binding protein
MKRRTLISGIATVPLVAALPAKAATKWDFYTFVPLTHPITVQLSQFADEVKKRSGGDLVINVRAAGELPFKANEVVKITGDGQVQLGEALALFTTGSAPLTGVTGLPMFIRSSEEAIKALPIVRKHASKEFERQNVKVLFHYLWPSVNIFGSGSPVQKPGDFSGRKLRTLSPQEAEMLRRLGAASVSLTSPEVPVAFERGTIEGVMTTAFNMIGSKWAEFSKWAYIADFHCADDYILVNTAEYNKLSPKTRKVLDDTAEEWAPKMTKANLAAEAGSLDELRTKYKVQVTRASKADTDQMTARMKDYWETWAQQQGPDAVAMLKEIRAAIGK